MRPISGHKAIAGNHLLPPCRSPGSDADQLIHLFERAFVQQQFDAFARGKLAFRVLPLAPFRAAAFFGGGVTAAQFFQTIHRLLL